jgi:hypothetical protein
MPAPHSARVCVCFQAAVTRLGVFRNLGICTSIAIRECLTLASAYSGTRSGKGSGRAGARLALGLALTVFLLFFFLLFIFEAQESCSSILELIA